MTVALLTTVRQMAQPLLRLARSPIFQAIAVSLLIALLVYGRHLFDGAVPEGGDVGAHIIRTEVLYDSLAHGSWPDWMPWWYAGFPLYQYYPPGFFFLGAVLTFVTQNVVISYKLLLFLALMSNGLSIYYFARRFLRLGAAAAILSLIAYEPSFFLLLNYAEGGGPNLLGWSITILFLTFYLSDVTEGRSRRALHGLLLGVSMMVHPFSAMFAVLAVVVFHVLELARSRMPRLTARRRLPYVALVFGIGALLSITYWLPYLLTRDYASPLYVSTEQFVGKAGLRVLILLTVVALVAGLTNRLTRGGVKDAGKADLVMAYFVVCSALGFGLTLWIPLIGTFLHPFRFATMMAPFFAIILIALTIDRLLKRDTALSGRSLAALGAVCLVAIPVVLPSALSYSKVARLALYEQNYLQADFVELFESAQGGRLIKPLVTGALGESDSFGWRYGVETVSGTYNQGDPKFFKYTVYLEWEERWLSREGSRRNLMHEGAAEYLFFRSPNGPYPDMQGMKRVMSNDYGQLWRLDAAIARAANVSPILLDVSDPQQVTDFFNVLVPGGYRMVFVDAREAGEDIGREFDYVMVDDESKIAGYGGRTIFSLRNTSMSDDMVSRRGNIVSLNVPYLDYANGFFYRGDRGDVIAWMTFANDLGSEAVNGLAKLGVELGDTLNELKYEAASYEYSENEIRVDGQQGFTLIKDSYFPYWGIDEGRVLPTTQGFMLTYSDDASGLLRYRKPAMNDAATLISPVAFAGIIAVLAVNAKRRKARKTR